MAMSFKGCNEEPRAHETVTAWTRGRTVFGLGIVAIRRFLIHILICENLRGGQQAEIAKKVLDVPLILSICNSAQLEEEARTGWSGGRDWRDHDV